MPNNLLGKLTQCGDDGFLDDGEYFIPRGHLKLVVTLSTTSARDISQVLSTISTPVYVHKKPDEEQTELYSPSPELANIQTNEEN